jgi:hypothetical protein
LITLLVAAFGLLGWRVYYLQHDCRDQYLQGPSPGTTVISPQAGRYFRPPQPRRRQQQVEQLFAEPRAFKTNDQILESSMQLQDIWVFPARHFD